MQRVVHVAEREPGDVDIADGLVRLGSGGGPHQAPARRQIDRVWTAPERWRFEVQAVLVRVASLDGRRPMGGFGNPLRLRIRLALQVCGWIVISLGDR